MSVQVFTYIHIYFFHLPHRGFSYLGVNILLKRINAGANFCFGEVTKEIT